MSPAAAMPDTHTPTNRARLTHPAIEGAALNTLAGEALFVGPTLFATFGHSYLLTAAFEAQVWGRAPGEPGALDLDNFTRYRRNCGSSRISEAKRRYRRGEGR